MRKDWKYILYVTLAIGLFVAVKLNSPRKYDWTLTLDPEDKDPYGTYALYELLPSSSGKPISLSYKTLYELKDSLRNNENLFFLCSRFSPGKEDVSLILKHVDAGGTALVSSQYYYGVFADTLNVSTHDEYFTRDRFGRKDSASLQFVNPRLDTTKRFWYRRDNIHNYFDKFDTLRTTVIASNDSGKPTTIKVAYGKGSLILNATPYVFTNIYLLAGENASFVSNTLSYLNDARIIWNAYYHMGRREISSPLRFILTTEPLRWAYYITLIAIVLFMIFEAKRKQRIIPVATPIANTTLEFVRTIGNLYFQRGNHKNAAEKKIQFLFEQIRTKYFLATNSLDHDFVKALSLKAGKPQDEVQSLIDTIKEIAFLPEITSDKLITLNSKIEDFNR